MEQKPATGDVLWEQRTNSGVIGVPSSYAIDGVQYIAVQSGWGVDAQGMQRAVNAPGAPGRRGLGLRPAGVT